MLDVHKKSKLCKILRKKPRKLTRDKSYTNLPTLETLDKQEESEHVVDSILTKNDTDVMHSLHRSVNNEAAKRKLQRSFIPYNEIKTKYFKTHRIAGLDPLIHDGDCIIESKFADLIHAKFID